MLDDISILLLSNVRLTSINLCSRQHYHGDVVAGVLLSNIVAHPDCHGADHENGKKFKADDGLVHAREDPYG